MHIRRSLLVLGAAASLGLGLLYQASPVMAAIPATHASGKPVLVRSTPFTITPDSFQLQKQKHVTPSAAMNCAQIRGYLQLYSGVIGGNNESYFAVQALTTTVVNGLHDGFYGYGGACAGGYATLHANFTCDGQTPQAPEIASGTAKFSKSVTWQSANCSYGMKNMRVEVCFTQPYNAGCSFSGYL
jgi:hypothetical protein